MAPKVDALCGSLITSRRSFLALAWTLTTLLSFFAFGVSVFLGIKITNQYNSMQTDDYADWYKDEYGNRYLNEDNNDNNNAEGNEGQEEQNHGSNDGDSLDEDFFESLATTNSRGLVFAGIYTAALGIALSLYGSTVVVGFMSAKGEYIPPCFSFRSMTMNDDEDGISDEDSITGPRKLWKEKIHRGIFLGSLVIFANLMLLCAIIFGELQVHDNYNNYDDQKHQNLFSYRIEKIASIFAITCVVLAFVYVLFAVIYTTCGGLSDDSDSAALDSSTRIRSSWGVSSYEMSSQIGAARSRRRRDRRNMGPSSIDKQEPLVPSEGFLTDADYSSQSSDGSSGRMQLS